MEERSTSQNELVISYLLLRKIIGILGIAFPFVLALGGMILFGTALGESISYYYHTGMGDVFVGTLCVIGFFLLSYRGYTPADNTAGNLACIFAVCVALFPTHETPEDHGIIGYLHLLFAALFFCTLIYFSLVLFRKTNPNAEMTQRKKMRNRVYTLCGYTMAACIALIAIYKVLPGSVTSVLEVLRPVFVLEALAILAFGLSWWTKGEGLLGDES